MGEYRNLTDLMEQYIEQLHPPVAGFFPSVILAKRKRAYLKEDKEITLLRVTGDIRLM